MTEPVGGNEADALGVAVSYTGGLSEAFQADVEGMRPVVGSLVEDLSRLRAASSGIEIDPLAGSIRGFETDVARILAGFAEIRRAQEQAVASGLSLGSKPLDVQLQSFAREQIGSAATRFETSSAGIPGAAEIAASLRAAAAQLASAAAKNELTAARRNIRAMATEDDAPQDMDRLVREAVGANSNRLNVSRLDPDQKYTPVEAEGERLRAALDSLTRAAQQAQQGLEEQARQTKQNAELQARENAQRRQPPALPSAEEPTGEVARREQASPPAPRVQDLATGGGGRGGSIPPPPRAPGDNDDDDFADRIVPPTADADQIRRRRAARLKALQQEWADYLEAAFQLPAQDRPQPFDRIGFDPLRPLGERAFHVNLLNDKGDDFQTANPYYQTIYEQKSGLRLLQDLVKGGDPHVVPTKDYYVDYQHNVEQPDVYTKQAGARITPASQDEYAKAMSQAEIAKRAQPEKFGDLLAIEAALDGAAQAEAERIAELNRKYEELYAQNLAKRLTSKIGYDPALPAGQRAFNTDTFQPLEGTEQEYYSRRGFAWELQKRQGAADPTLTPVGRNVLKDTSAGDGPDTQFYFRSAGEALIASTEQVRAALSANKTAIERVTAAANQEALLRYQSAAAEEAAARAGAFTPTGARGLLDYFKSGFLGTYGHGGGGAGGRGGGGGGGDGDDGRSGAFNALAELTQQGGMAAKYSLLYGGAYKLMQLLPAMAADVVATDTAITDLNLAFDGTTTVSTALTNSLENVAAVSGTSVSQAMAVAAQGVRAFRDEVGNTAPALNRLAVDFADQANQISVITGAAITDAGKFQTAIASGFNLPKNQTGFSQITDAIAGARNITGGDPNEIMSGLGAGAVDFHQLGFSLDQAAILVGKINATTGDSGDTAVQRLSRVGEILGSQTGRNYISQTLNPSLRAEERINTSGTPAEQLAQLAKVLPGLNPAQQNAAASALGGPQGQKEFLATMQAAKDLGQQILPGTGADEFKAKVDSIAGTLKDILGNVRAVIQNLATSGLADPIIALLEYGLKPLTAALKYLTQAFDTVTGLMPQWAQTFLFAIPEVVLLLKGIQAVRGNGVGGALRAVEGVVRPQAALARAQLEDRAGGAANPLARVPVTLTNTETAATRALDSAAAAVEADTAELVRIQRALDAQESRQSRTRTDFVQANPGDEAGLATLEAQQAQERAALQQRLNDQRAQVVTSTVDQNRAGVIVATEQGRYSDAAAAKAQAVEAAQQRFAATIDGIRAQAAGLAAGSAELTAVEREEAQARAAFVAELRAIDAEELVAREAAIVEQAAGGAAGAAGGLMQGLKGFAGGLVGGLGGLGVGLVATAAVTALIDGIGTLKETSDKLTSYVQEGRGNQNTTVGTQGGQYAATADAFHQMAQNDAAAAEAIKRNRTGFFGGLAAGMNPDAERVQHDNETLNKYDKEQGDRLQQLQDAQNRALGSGVPGAIDLSGTDDVATSLKNLADQGYSASRIVDAVTAALKQLSFVSDPFANKLTQTQIGAIGAGVGRTAIVATQNSQRDVAALQNDAEEFKRENGGEATPAQLQAFLNPNGGFAANDVKQFLADNPGANPLTAITNAKAIAGLDSGSLGEVVNQATTGFLNDPKNSGKDLTAPSTIDAYQQVLEASLRQAQVPPELASTIAAASAQQFSAQVANLKTVFSDPKKVQDLLTNGPAYLQQQQADVANQTKIANAAKGGVTVDNSQMTGLQSVQTSLQEWRAAAQAAIQSGAINKDDAPRVMAEITALQTKNQADLIEAGKQQAQQTIAYNDKARQAEQRNATSAEQVRAIGQKYINQNYDAAVKSGDIDTITAVFNTATAKQVADLKAAADRTAATDKLKLAMDKKLLEQAKQYLQFLKGTGAGTGEIDNAQAVVDGLTKQVGADTTRANASARGAANVDAAAKAANPQGTAAEGTDANGGTQDQIAAMNEAAKAEKNRDSLGKLKAALDKANADAKAPGLNAAQRAQAAEAVAQAQNAYDDGVRAQAAAIAKSTLYPTDKVGAAKADLDAARANLNVYAKGSKEWADAQAAFTKAQYDYDQAVTDAYFNKVKANSDLTDPIAQAAQEVRKAKAKLNYDKKHGADADTINQDQIGLNDKRNSEEATLNQRNNSHLDDLLSAQKISHAQYIQGLQAEAQRIQEKLALTKKGTNGYQQLQDELLKQEGKIKSASSQMQGMFNLGDIKVPTVYEVRRAIASQSGAASAIANSTVNNNQHITINGVDIDKALEALERAMQAKLNGGRHGSRHRKA